MHVARAPTTTCGGRSAARAPLLPRAGPARPTRLRVGWGGAAGPSLREPREAEVGERARATTPSRRRRTPCRARHRPPPSGESVSRASRRVDARRGRMGDAPDLRDPAGAPTRSPSAPTNGVSPYAWSGITASRVRGHQRNAWWSLSASDHPLPRANASSRVGAAEVGDVEQRGLRPERPGPRRRVLADPEQKIVTDRVQVRRVAADLQLSAHDRLRRRDRSSV